MLTKIQNLNLALGVYAGIIFCITLAWSYYTGKLNSTPVQTSVASTHSISIEDMIRMNDEFLSKADSIANNRGL